MVELETQGELTRYQIASFLREFAAELERPPDQGRPSIDFSSDADAETPRSGEGTNGTPIAEFSAGQSSGERSNRTTADSPEGSTDRPDTATAETDTATDESASEPNGDGVPDTKRLTFVSGGKSATVMLPQTVDFDVAVQSKSPMLQSGVSQEIDFEISWELEDPDDQYGDQIEIE